MRRIVATLAAVALTVVATACATTKPAAPAASATASAGKPAKVVRRAKDPLADYSFGSGRDYDTAIYRHANKNRYSIAFEAP